MGSKRLIFINNDNLGDCSELSAESWIGTRSRKSTAVNEGRNFAE